MCASLSEVEEGNLATIEGAIHSHEHSHSHSGTYAQAPQSRHRTSRHGLMSIYLWRCPNIRQGPGRVRRVDARFRRGSIEGRSEWGQGMKGEEGGGRERETGNRGVEIIWRIERRRVREISSRRSDDAGVGASANRPGSQAPGRGSPVADGGVSPDGRARSCQSDDVGPGCEPADVPRTAPSGCPHRPGQPRGGPIHREPPSAGVADVAGHQSCWRGRLPEQWARLTEPVQS